MSIKARIIDAIIFIVGTLIFKKAFPKLTENAVSGWVDDKIGEFLGWSSPDASTVLSWIWPATAVALVLWGYHVLYNRFVRPPSVAIYTIRQPIGTVRENIISQIPHHLYAHAIALRAALGIRVIIAWILIIGCGIGLAAGIVLLATSNPPSVAVAKANAPSGSSAPNTIPGLPRVNSNAAPPAPLPKRYTAYEKDRRLRAVDEIYEVFDSKLSPAYAEGRDLFNSLKNESALGTAQQKLRDHYGTVERAFNELKPIRKKYEYYLDIVAVTGGFDGVPEMAACDNLTTEIAFLQRNAPNAFGPMLERNIVWAEARAANREFQAFINQTMALLKKMRQEIESAEIYAGTQQ
jgi:hypothetical protein